MNKGLYEANLGSGLYKKRVARKGDGKRGSYRTLIAFKNEQIAFFLFGFAKNSCDDIGEQELKVYRKLAKDFLNMSFESLQKMLTDKKLFEVK